MIASVYIKDGNIYFHNEDFRFTNIGGVSYELGRPLLNFVCYEPERFDDGFSVVASALDNTFAYLAIKEPEFLNAVKESAQEFQWNEIYVYLYRQMFFDFIYTFVESPRQAITRLEELIPGAMEKLRWTVDFEWPTPPPGMVYEDKEKRLYRAALDVVALMSEDLKLAQEATIYEIETLLLLREDVKTPEIRSLNYLFMLDELHKEHHGAYFFLERPFRVFYGVVSETEIAELYEIDSIKDLIRFEFIKMIERDIFVRKCKNCERFFIPRRRVDAEYCERIFGNTNRKCSEIGAMLKYEKKVAENPVWEVYKKAYRRLHSRVRNKKMGKAEFMAWADEASRKRDECLAGTLAFEKFVEWLEQGRVRRARGSAGK